MTIFCSTRTFKTPFAKKHMKVEYLKSVDPPCLKSNILL